MNLLQIASVQDTLQQITTSVEPQTTTNALDLAFKGGWLMIVLLVLLLLSVYVLIEDIGDKQSQTGGQLLYEPHQGLHPGWKN